MPAKKASSKTVESKAVESTQVEATSRKVLTDKLSIYIPDTKAQLQPVQRLMKLASSQDRSVNYLVVEAILSYLDREEKK